MKVSSVSFYNTNSINKNRNNVSFKAGKITTDELFITDEKNYRIVVDANKMKIQGSSQEHLVSLGQIFRLTNDELIFRRFCTHPISGDSNPLKKRKLYQILMPHVINAREEYAKLQNELEKYKEQPLTMYTIMAKSQIESRIRYLDEKTTHTVDFTKKEQVPESSSHNYFDFSDKPKKETEEDLKWWDTVMY